MIALNSRLDIASRGSRCCPALKLSIFSTCRTEREKAFDKATRGVTTI